MQAKWDQRPLNQAENQGTHIAGSGHQTAKRIDSVLDNRPYEIQQDADKHVDNG